MSYIDTLRYVAGAEPTENGIGGPVAATVEHYIGVLRQLNAWSSYLTDALGWWVVRLRGASLSLPELIRRLGCDPESISWGEPRDLTNMDTNLDEWDAGVYIEQRGPVAVLVETHPGRDISDDALCRLSVDATVHGMFWLVNNLARLYFAADGRIVTEVDPLGPDRRWGADPHALDAHLGPLRELEQRRLHGELGSPDWETALATVDTITGERLTADWFARPQILARFPRRP